MVKLIFNQCNTGNYSALIQNFFRYATYDLPKTKVVDCSMIDFRAVMFTQSDEHHFHQTTFDITGKICVRFDSIANDNMICFPGMLIKVHWKSFFSLADDMGFHSGFNRATQKLFSHSIPFDNCPLAFRRSTTMTSHRWYDKGFASKLLNMLNNRSNRRVDICNPSTTRRDSNRITWLYFFGQIQFCELRFHCTCHIFTLYRLKMLSNFEYARKVSHDSSTLWVILAGCYNLCHC